MTDLKKHPLIAGLDLLATHSGPPFNVYPLAVTVELSTKEAVAGIYFGTTSEIHAIGSGYSLLILTQRNPIQLANQRVFTGSFNLASLFTQVFPIIGASVAITDKNISQPNDREHASVLSSVKGDFQRLLAALSARLLELDKEISGNKPPLDATLHLWAGNTCLLVSKETLKLATKRVVQSKAA